MEVVGHHDVFSHLYFRSVLGVSNPAVSNDASKRVQENLAGDNLTEYFRAVLHQNGHEVRSRP